MAAWEKKHAQETEEEHLHTAAEKYNYRPQQPYSKSLGARPKESKLAQTAEPGQLH